MRSEWKQPTQAAAHRILTKGFVIALAVFALLSASRCGGSPSEVVSTVTTNSPTATSTPTATPSPSPLPTVAIAGGIAGWQTLQSLHWTGYTFPQRHVTGVRAQWQEPVTTGSAGEEEFTWIGIGGWGPTNDNIVQIGTFAYYPSTGGHNQGIWYELVPGYSQAQYPSIHINPGDQIFASVEQVQPPQQSWQLLLVDVTTGATFQTVLQFDSLTAYPSFVVEAPNDGPASSSGPFYPMPHWGQVTFSHMQVRIDTTWTSAATLYGDRIIMVRNGQSLATAGALNVASTFTATQA